MNIHLIEKTLKLIREGKRDNLKPLIELQNELSSLTRIKSFNIDIETVAGCDISYSGNYGYCAIIVMDRELNVIEESYFSTEVKFPYIPTFLTYREFEVFWGAYNRLKHIPDIVIFDGQGLAHPRMCGIATHAGVVLEKPTIGCAKSHLYGEWSMPRNVKGDKTPIKIAGNIIGYTIRTKEGVKPIFASVGNLVSPLDSYNVIMRFTTKYRLPLPTHLAHKKCTLYKKQSIN